MTSNLYLLRHGQTAFSRDNIFSGCGSNPKLTENGLAMAQAFAQTYRATDWRAVYASPLKRTVASARPICDAIGKAMILRDDLREISYGRWEGLTVEDVQRDFPEDYPRFLSDAARYPPTGGESALA